jgi:glycosyltransferase involved in cell wall biosynthesis
LFLGRLDVRKGVDVLLNALSAAESCRLDLVVAGKGPESAALAALAERLGLASRVHFVGQVDGDRKVWLLQNGVCTILSSRIWEAFPVVLLESYAAGRPVIATDVPGLRERVQPGRTGLLVTPENPRRMADAIVHMTTERRQADAWGSEAQRFVRQFDWHGIALRHLDLFQSLAERRRAKAA